MLAVTPRCWVCSGARSQSLCVRHAQLVIEMGRAVDELFEDKLGNLAVPAWLRARSQPPAE